MARRGARRGGDAELHNDERWMASYMDMVTVLMCLFIVLFAMSSTDAGKYQQLRDSLADGFGVDIADDVPDGVAPSPTPTPSEAPEEPPTEIELAVKEIENLEAIRDQINARLVAQGLQDSVNYTIDENGLTVRLVGAETFFGGSSAALTARATQVLSSVGGVIAGIPNQISVEGNTALIGSPAPFASDWDLSSARATSVVRFFAEQAGVPANRLAAIGYSNSRPVTTDLSEQAQRNNRRVDVVIRSNQPESVRALIPGLLAAAEGS